MSSDPEQSPTPSGSGEGPQRRVLKIGSQRPGHEIIPPAEKEMPPIPEDKPDPSRIPRDRQDAKSAQPARSGEPAERATIAEPAHDDETPSACEESAVVMQSPAAPASPPPAATKPQYPPPRPRRMSDDLQREIDDALGGVSIDELLAGTANQPDATSEPEIDKRYRSAVVKIHREDVFFTLPGHYEGVASLRQFATPPEPGTIMEVVVNRFNAEEGLYEVSVPGASAEVHDWSDLGEGVIVEALITGHNTGGLECEVQRIRGFIPISQVTMYRVEDLEEFVGQKMACVVTEANPSRGNLVLSRRAMLERERAEAKEKLMEALAEGQIRDGVVRKIMDFGAFVDIGGVDGLIHVSKLSWDRVQHPSEVVEEGQKVKVKVEKIDPANGRIGLSLRDLVEHPWEKAAQKYVENTVATGVVSKIADFGAFVRLEPGVEGLVHISELAHHRVVRVSNVVNVGDDVTVKILSVDPENQRMSLSIKAALAAPIPVSDGKDDDEPDEPPRESVVKKKHQGELRGGTNRKTGGEQFGLQW